jgi:hypothetical protein
MKLVPLEALIVAPLFAVGAGIFSGFYHAGAFFFVINLSCTLVVLLRFASH